MKIKRNRLPFLTCGGIASIRPPWPARRMHKYPGRNPRHSRQFRLPQKDVQKTDHGTDCRTGTTILPTANQETLAAKTFRYIEKSPPWTGGLGNRLQSIVTACA